MRIPHIDPRNAAGLTDKVVGLGKELSGETLGKQQWIKAGEAQQVKGSERLKALREQAEAAAHDAKARASESRQRAAQNAKEHG